MIELNVRQIHEKPKKKNDNVVTVIYTCTPKRKAGKEFSEKDTSAGNLLTL